MEKLMNFEFFDVFSSIILFFTVLNSKIGILNTAGQDRD